MALTLKDIEEEIDREIESALDRGGDETERKVMQGFQKLFAAMQEELVGAGNTTPALQMFRPKDTHGNCKPCGQFMLSFRHPANEYREYLTTISLTIRSITGEITISFREQLTGQEAGWQLHKDDWKLTGSPQKKGPWEWVGSKVSASSHMLLSSLHEELLRKIRNGFGAD